MFNRRIPFLPVLLSLVLGCADGPIPGMDLGDAGGDRGPDGAPGGNQAPVLARIGDKIAVVNEEMAFFLRASDPDGDLLEFSVFGDLPQGATFSKEDARFNWTPAETDLDTQWMITFSVTDKKLEDRETITISVHSTRDNGPPQFVEPGDQILTVNQAYELLLEATDPDSDTLQFSLIGAYPDGAEFDGQKGVFRWTPGADDANANYRLLFEVSDGPSTDEMFVNLKVGAATIAFDPIPPQTVRLNEPLELSLPIQNPAAHSVTCSILGTPPAGSSFDSTACVFRWTPTDPALAGQTFQVPFQATDGEVTLVQTASISVVQGGSGTCQSDAFEDIESQDQVPLVGAGTYTSIPLCSEDTDTFAIEMAVGQSLTVTASFEHDQLDIDLALFDPAAQQAFQVSNGYSDTETVHVASIPTAGYWYILVYSEFPGISTYDLAIEVSTLSSCTDDSYEENDSLTSARNLAVNATHSAQLCQGDEDWYRFDANAGQSLNIAVQPAGAIDLDIALFEPGNTTSPSWNGQLVSNREVISVSAVPTTGTYYLKVTRQGQGNTAYTIELALTTPSCPADALESSGGNNDENHAYGIDDKEFLTDLTYCEPDWYYFVAPAGDAVLIAVDYDTGTHGIPTVILKRYGLTGNIGLIEYDSLGLLVTLDPVPAEDVYVLGVTRADIGMEYSLSLQIFDQ